MPAPTMDEVVALCKRRGLIFPASEIYGGIANTYDYGHYGVLLKNNVINAWWKAMIQERDDVVALDSAIIQHPRTWEASGHLAGFTDPLVDCKKCGSASARTTCASAQCGRKPSKHAGRAAECDLTEPRAFNLMFETTIGPVEESGSTVYLRPETAQGIFLDFKTTLQYARRKPPFGIAQVGKSFRNEITPGNFIFRTLEFEQMEMEFFVPPAEAEQWHEHWMQARMDWYVVARDRPRAAAPARARRRRARRTTRPRRPTSSTCIRSAGPSSRASPTAATSTSSSTPSTPARSSSTSTRRRGERYVPHVIEPAAGVGRTMLALLCDAYDEDEIGGEKRTVLRLSPAVAPVKVAVLPLLRKDGHPEKATRDLPGAAQARLAEYDSGGHIGKRYRRQDEIGTPLADHRRPPDAGGRHGHAARARHARRRSACRSASSCERVTELTR